jgi:hypothetical protein
VTENHGLDESDGREGYAVFGGGSNVRPFGERRRLIDGTAALDPYADVPTVGAELEAQGAAAPPVDVEDVNNDTCTVGAREWPTPSDGVYQGVAGYVVEMVRDHTEADPIAVLATLLAAVGAACGRGSHLLVANDAHPARIWPMIIGKTSTGAKGTSWSLVRTILGEADAEFLAKHTVSGLSSGEGLIDRVRDRIGDDTDAKDFDEGVEDKRLLVVETEFAAVLARVRREGSTLGTYLRDAWDGRTLSAMNRRHNKLTATDPHITLIAHITPTELLSKLSETDLSGGSFNRHLPILSRRSKLLPDGGNLPAAVLADIGAVVREVIGAERIRSNRRIHWDDGAAGLWREQYARLSRDLPDGRLADATARARPTVCRIALTYALFDQSAAVRKEHLNAALALWGYSTASARYLFGTESGTAAEKLLEFIKAAGRAGATKTEINTKHFSGNAKKDVIDGYLKVLIETGSVKETKDGAARGRPTYRYYAT